jgi:hypothetical protein
MARWRTATSRANWVSIRAPAGATGRRIDFIRHDSSNRTPSGHRVRGRHPDRAALSPIPCHQRNSCSAALSRACEPAEILLIDEPARRQQRAEQIAERQKAQDPDILEPIGRRLRERADQHPALERLGHADGTARGSRTPARPLGAMSASRGPAAMPYRLTVTPERAAERLLILQRISARDDQLWPINSSPQRSGGPGRTRQEKFTVLESARATVTLANGAAAAAATLAAERQQRLRRVCTQTRRPGSEHSRGPRDA